MDSWVAVAVGVCLDALSVANVVLNGQYSNPAYQLNGDTTYDAGRRYGLYDGTYTIKDVFSNHPIAILNADISNNIQYGGTLDTSEMLHGTISDMMM